MAIKKLVKDRTLTEKKYFFSTNSAGVTYSNPFIMNTSYVLAYSLRNIGAYGGPVIRVRRSSDSSELDIFPFNLQSDLNDFVGTGSNNHGFISKWYDQSPVQNHAYTTVLSEQPIIVLSGSLLLKNSRPSVRFNNSTLNMTVTSSVSDQSIYATIAPESSIAPESAPPVSILVSTPTNRVSALVVGQFSSTETSEVISWTDTATSPFSNRAVYTRTTLSTSLQLMQVFALPASSSFAISVNASAQSLFAPTPSPHGTLTSTRYPNVYNKFFTADARPIYCSELILYNINTTFTSGSSDVANLHLNVYPDIINYYGIT